MYLQRRPHEFYILNDRTTTTIPPGQFFEDAGTPLTALIRTLDPWITAAK